MNNLVKFTIFVFLVFSRTNSLAQINYVSPVNHSDYNNPNTSIIIRFDNPITSFDKLDSQLKLSGCLKENYEFKCRYIASTNLLLIEPVSPFVDYDTISLSIERPLVLLEDTLSEFKYWFIVSSKIEGTSDMGYIEEPLHNLKTDKPEGFPSLIVTVNDNPSLGKIFFYNLSELASNNDRFMSIIDSTGAPLFAKQENAYGLNFTLQPSGYISLWYNDGFALMDSTYSIVDHITCGNGYTADWHDFIHLKNGHSFLIAWDLQNIDMSKIVPGGHSSALVRGLVIQELDETKNVIFQWRSWDHFEITDAIGVDFTQNIFSYVHGNAIDIDNDGNILLSCRLMNEITKINRFNGEIIWRFGGKNNQFTLINDENGFCRQHDIRRISNENITLYDNGECHTPQITTAKEYHLDENNMTAELVWDYSHPSNMYCDIMGNVQRMENGNTYINWGSIPDASYPAITEVNQEKEIVYELYFKEDFNLLYRSSKHEWNNDYEVTTSSNYSTEKNSDNKKLEVYPNPANKVIELKFPYDKVSNFRDISIMDIEGRSYKPVVILKKRNSLSLDISSLYSGVYFITAHTINKKLSTKFIKN